jgi:putative ABC transport system permease protein
MVSINNADWSFILIRLDTDRKIARVKKDLASLIKDQGINVRILDWYTAAGTNAQLLFALKSALNTGIIFLIAGAMMMLINSLVISVLERTNEIGTMRALGIQKGQIIQLVLFEISIFTIGSASIGLAAGAIIISIINQVGVELNNPLLISLFGGSLLQPRITPNFVILFIISALSAALLAGLYPVQLALSVSPREAILDGE